MNLLRSVSGSGVWKKGSVNNAIDRCDLGLNPIGMTFLEQQRSPTTEAVGDPRSDRKVCPNVFPLVNAAFTAVIPDGTGLQRMSNSRLMV